METDKKNKDRYWIFLDKDDAENVRVLAKKRGLSLSAYVRQLIKKNLDENITHP